VLSPEEVRAADHGAVTHPYLQIRIREPLVAEREMDSSTDSDRASPKATTRLARCTPGQPLQAASTDRSSGSEVCRVRNAESATTTPARNGDARARSTTVLATEVTGIPRHAVT
jgi:hypothetical protein